MASEGFIQGYETGVRWKESYIPGGPHYRAPEEKDKERKPEQYKRDVKALQHHKDWHIGFAIGKDHKDFGPNLSFLGNPFVLDLLEENYKLKEQIKKAKQCLMSFNFSIRDVSNRTEKTLETL